MIRTSRVKLRKLTRQALLTRGKEVAVLKKTNMTKKLAEKANENADLDLSDLTGKTGLEIT